MSNNHELLLERAGWHYIILEKRSGWSKDGKTIEALPEEWTLFHYVIERLSWEELDRYAVALANAVRPGAYVQIDNWIAIDGWAAKLMCRANFSQVEAALAEAITQGPK